MAGNAIGLGIVTVVSQCVGAGSYEKARFYTKKLMIMAYIAMFVCIVAIYFATPPILRLYSVSPEAERYAYQIIWMHGFFGMLIWPLSFTLPQALRAAGDTRFTMIVSSVSMWTMRVGFGRFHAGALPLQGPSHGRLRAGYQRCICQCSQPSRRPRIP